MLDDELEKINAGKLSAKSLKYALLAIGYAVLSSLAEFAALDSAGNRSGPFLFRLMITLYYLLEIVSGTYAFMACKNSIKSLRTNKNNRNYIALIIGGILLFGIGRQILRFF